MHGLQFVLHYTAWKQLTIARGEAEGNSQLFPGPTESQEPDGVFCWPRDQSLFVFYIIICLEVKKFAIHKICNLHKLHEVPLCPYNKCNYIHKNNTNRPINNNNRISKTSKTVYN